MDHHFKRDLASNALINTDKGSLEAYKTRKKQSQRMELIADDINTLKAEFEEIKTLLRQLINKE